MFKSVLSFESSSIEILVGLVVDSDFYCLKSYFGCLSKKGDSNMFLIAFKIDNERYELKILKNNIREVIVSESNDVYIKTKNRPILDCKTNSRSSRVPYSLFFPQSEDFITTTLFPHFFTIKLASMKCITTMLKLLCSWEIRPFPGYLIEKKWTERPDFSSIFNDSFLPWKVKYSLLVLLTNSLMSLEDLSLKNLELILSSEKYSLSDLFFTNTQFADISIEALAKPKPKPYSKFLIKSINITPTTIVFSPPIYEKGNRVIRKYQNHCENFLRVNFTDEDLEKKTWTGSCEVLQRFRRLLDSLFLLDTQFEFLGFSNSQMRNHSCWMVEKTPFFQADQIRAELGDFSMCRNIAKYSSRLGLCFSETFKTLKIEDSRIIKIEDIKRNDYIFSDGIGKISPEFLLEARHILKVKDTDEISAVQIRFGGYKGVLVLAPELDCSIALRPSMCKFKCKERELEVCTFAKYKPAFLNRQIVLLLHGLGVSEEVFFSLQERMISESLKSLQADRENISNKPGKNLKSQVSRDSSFSAILKEIKTKARILAPQSALLMGVLDEYSILLPNEAYIKISGNGSSQVITGKVVIAKNPCLHPGDVKVLTATNRPELAHLANVIVFPQKGERPLPDECSGSDLDGDEYFVSWNPELVPFNYSNAMNYEKDEEIVDDKLSISKVKDYFIGYMRSDTLGKIANMHMVYADLYGIFSEQALFFAMLHSKAVDYPKTGIQVLIPHKYRLEAWPDFMEKPKSCYESPGILGKLFRSISDF